MANHKYISERLNKFISEGEVILNQYNQKGNIDKHDIWITEVRNLFSVFAPEYNKKLNDIADKFKDALIEQPYGRASYNYIQQQLEVIRLAKDSLSKRIIDSKSQNDKMKQYQKSKIFNKLESNDIWTKIEKEYGISKRAFGKKINFVLDTFKRKIIFRDIEQAYILSTSGFSKPAVILAGSVIEELLRQYLKYKKIPPDRDKFDCYIETCKNNSLLKSAIHSLTESVRHFRNLVHLAKEKSSKHTISKATAKGAVSSIFTIANDFEK